MIQAVAVYFACLENPNVLDYYSEVMEGMNCLVWDALVARHNMEMSNWPQASKLVGWIGSPVISSGT